MKLKQEQPAISAVTTLLSLLRVEWSHLHRVEEATSYDAYLASQKFLVRLASIDSTIKNICNGIHFERISLKCLQLNSIYDLPANFPANFGRKRDWQSRCGWWRFRHFGIRSDCSII